MRQISLTEAKANLSSLVADVRTGEPVIITRRGKAAAALLSFEEYERLSRIPRLGRLLAAFPGDAGDLPDRTRG